MKKLLYSLVLFTVAANAQVVDIPDPVFKAYLLSASPISDIAMINPNQRVAIDINQNGEIEVNEALAINRLLIQGSGITDVTGIQAFANLGELNVSYCGVTSLDVSGMTSLGILRCFNNQLTSLNFSNVPYLGILDCSANNLTSLYVDNLTFLQEVYCSGNQLSIFNPSNLSYLRAIACNNNQLTGLNLNGLPNLESLECDNNLLTSLNCSALSKLFDMSCTNNLLTSLDLSNSHQLLWLDCSLNQLDSLFIKNGAIEASSDLNFSENTGLHFICADENQIAEVQALASLFGLNVLVNSYCSMTPGGDYNTITGNITFDSDNNGCDASDDLQSNIRIDINDGTHQGAVFSTNGNYTFYTPAGSFGLTPSFENLSLFNVSPPSATIAFADDNNHTTTQNFCLSANGVSPDVEVVIAPIGVARPGFNAVYLVVYKNKGNQALTGNVTFAYNDAVLDFVSSTVTPNSVATGLLSYDYTNLLPFENRGFYITLNVNAPTETPPVNIGDQLTFVAVVNPVLGDIKADDNTFQYNETVVGSYDPNNIICIEGNVVSPSQIGNYLHYVISFENTGTADAENIVIRDVIDTNQFDVNSLQLLNSSAAVTARLTGNVAEFIFPNINLHSGGHGNILLKVKTKNTLVEGNTVSKRANIFFDYNFPVETLPENTVFQSLSNPDVALDASIAVYPNPTNGLITIECNNTIKSVQLYDVQGRVLQTDLVNDNQTSLDLSIQSSGIYFIKIISDKGIKVQKIVKE